MLVDVFNMPVNSFKAWRYEVNQGLLTCELFGDECGLNPKEISYCKTIGPQWKRKG